MTENEWIKKMHEDYRKWCEALYDRVSDIWFPNEELSSPADAQPETGVAEPGKKEWGVK